MENQNVGNRVPVSRQPAASRSTFRPTEGTPVLPVILLFLFQSHGLGQVRDIHVEPIERQASLQPSTWAVLIGVDDYQEARPLKYCTADAALLAKTLIKRGGLKPNHILVMTKEQAPELWPIRENILEQVPRFLKQACPGDSVIVFFSGHGFRCDAGKTFLAPSDCDIENLAPTAVPMILLRQDLESCQASTKVLVIDACHAGNTKGEQIGLTGKDLETDMEEAAGVYTLASCQARERSLYCDEKKQGLFTYWLNRGLEGSADDNGDAAISVEELHRFVNFQVSHAAEHRFHCRQTPVQIVGPDVPGIPIMLRLKPEPVMSTLRRVGELVHEQALCRGVGKLGVLEFTCLIGNREMLRGNVGPFGRTAAGKVEEALVQLAGNRYGVADQRQVAYATKDLTVEELGNPEALQELRDRPPKLEAILTGTFLRIPNPDRLRLTCKLLQLPGGELLASVSGVVHIDEDLWGLLGQSANATQVPPAPALGRLPPTPVQALNEQAKLLNPVLDPDFKFPIAIYSEGRKKPFFQLPGRPNDLFFAGRPGEEFEIRVRNRSPRSVLMRLLVDGVNTIVQHDNDSDVQHVLLDEARGWILDPDSEYPIEGWYMGVGDNAEVDRFRFVDPPRAVASQLGFSEDIGMITAAFYAKQTSRGAGANQQMGVGRGRKETRNTPVPVPFPVGRMLAAVTIRYVHEDAAPKE